ncbi:hypothetical protein [Sphingopyxis fribergensis]|uniref:hypothetical protein n=1 Tax=Sphingopyxis fribergensis TaxID=1515612 RepID=UPI0011DDBF52|nr:hypothetical protein [Sphingopyxis fribergensis]
MTMIFSANAFPLIRSSPDLIRLVDAPYFPLALMKKEHSFDKLKANGIGKRAIILQNCATHAIWPPSAAWRDHSPQPPAA